MGRLHPAQRPAALVSLAAVAAALAVLVGCAAVEPPASSGTTAAASTTPPTSAGDRTAAPFVSDAPTDACVGGFAWMTFHDDDPSEKSLPGGCDTVVVAGADGTLHSGPARVVVVMGARNHVEVETVTQVDVEGVDNEIVHGGEAEPIVNTDGAGNVVTAR